MPIYQDENVEGVCERLGNPCVREELFVKYAKRYDAEPQRPSGTLMVEGRPVAWSYYTLNIRGDRKKAAIRALIRKQRVAEPDIEADLARMTARAQLKELPCHLKCDVTICGYCKKQHERRFIRDGTCDVLLAMEGLDPGDADRDAQGEDADLETDYVDPRWPTTGGNNGSR